MADHPPPMKHRKSALLAVAGAYNDQVDELSTLRARIGELEAENARLKGDAEKWHLLMSSARIRIMGSAGFGYRDGSVPPSADGYRHMGVEFWTRHTAPTSQDCLDTIGKYIDAMRALSSEREG